MKKSALVAAVVFVLGSAVTALASPSVPWRVFATGSDTGTYGAFSSASADAPKSNGLAVRATATAGKTIKLSVYMNCQADLIVASGQLVVLATPRFRKCSVSGNALTDYPGRVKVELLRR